MNKKDIKKRQKFLKVETSQANKFVNKLAINKRLSLIIPFILITILLVVAPLIVIIINIFNPSSGTVQDNWGIMTGTIWNKIGKSIWISLVSTIIILVISFPFAYALAQSKNKVFQTLTILIVTAPIWINILIKLIGLKSLFDIMNHELNSTYGDIFTIIGLVYLFTPLMILPIYSALQTLPKNLINASKDLGRSNIYTFFMVTIPWCKTAIISGITLVLLPCFTTVTVTAFLNNSNDGSMIGGVIMGQGESGLSSPIALARTSVLVLIVSGFTLLLYISIVYLPKIVWFIKRKWEQRHYEK